MESTYASHRERSSKIGVVTKGRRKEEINEGGKIRLRKMREGRVRS